MWMAGALGVCCGAGYYTLAVIATLMTVIILTVLNRIELGSAPRGIVPQVDGAQIGDRTAERKAPTV